MWVPGVRGVMRWESSLGRPVHRLQVLLSRQYWGNLGSVSPAKRGVGARSVSWNDSLSSW